MFLFHGLAALGYVVVGVFYAAAGVTHFRHVRELSDVLAARGVPWPRASLIAGSLFQTVAGTMLALQAYVRFAALGLAVFTVAASLIFLDVRRQTGAARQAAIRAWQTNLALVGALVVIGAR
jgi:putative oxidoreductase